MVVPILKVQNMFTDLKAKVKDWESEEEITAYLQKILNKEAFDHAGLSMAWDMQLYTLRSARSDPEAFCTGSCRGERHDRGIQAL